MSPRWRGLCYTTLPEATIITPVDGTDAVTPATLEGMAFRLSQRGDTMGLLGLMDAWQAEDEPTVAARFLHAQTLIDLCLVDKATTILAMAASAPMSAMALAGHCQRSTLSLWRMTSGD